MEICRLFTIIIVNNKFAWITIRAFAFLIVQIVHTQQPPLPSCRTDTKKFMFAGKRGVNVRILKYLFSISSRRWSSCKLNVSVTYSVEIYNFEGKPHWHSSYQSIFERFGYTTRHYYIELGSHTQTHTPIKMLCTTNWWGLLLRHACYYIPNANTCVYFVLFCLLQMWEYQLCLMGRGERSAWWRWCWWWEKLPWKCLIYGVFMTNARWQAGISNCWACKRQNYWIFTAISMRYCFYGRAICVCASKQAEWRQSDTMKNSCKKQQFDSVMIVVS